MFRFTIRDLLWLMVVAGLACGWWISLAKARATWRIEREQIYVEWRKERDQHGDFVLRTNTTLSKLPADQRDELFRAILGGTGK
jgi:hypothetical protein